LAYPRPRTRLVNVASHSCRFLELLHELQADTAGCFDERDTARPERPRHNPRSPEQILSQPRLTSARRPFFHSIGSLTVAPAARYHSHAASRSITFTARLAIPTTAMRGIVGLIGAVVAKAESRWRAAPGAGWSATRVAEVDEPAAAVAFCGGVRGQCRDDRQRVGLRLAVATIASHRPPFGRNTVRCRRSC
jgi:hypothetical protein